MSHSDASTLITRGRKAGLSTQELYAALSARPPEGLDGRSGQADENGYVSHIDEQGHCVYRQVNSKAR